jgi:hypothetical protein
MIKRLRFLALAIFVLQAALWGGLVSCGIETYKYLEPVDPGISMTLNETAYISLPGGQPNYFRYFIIYYRIYISDQPVSSTVDTGALAQINSALHTDYNYFLSYTNSQSTVAPTTMGATFAGRKYFPLELEYASTESLLDTGGRVITLDFAANPQFKPSLVMGDLRTETPGSPYTRYQLSRNTRNDNTPYANNYYFINSEDVNNGDHISSDSSNINQDVQNSPQSISGPKYTYAAMYILAHGLDDSNFTNIYSIPTFIGIFRLPEE